MKQWNFHPLFDLQPIVHRPVFAPDLSKPCPTFKPCANYVPTWIHLPIKTNFFFYHVKLAENGKNKTSRSEQALPCIFQPCGNYLYLYLFKPDRLRIFLDLSNPCLFFNPVATTFEYACHYQFLYQQAENMVQNFNSRSEQSCLNLLKALWSTCPLDLKLTLDCWYYGRASTNTVLNQMYFTQQWLLYSLHVQYSLFVPYFRHKGKIVF